MIYQKKPEVIILIADKGDFTGKKKSPGIKGTLYNDKNISLPGDTAILHMCIPQTTELQKTQEQN